MQILYQDNRIFVCIKPAGVLSTDEPGGMPGLIRSFLGDAHACVRTVHRLDRAVAGVMVYARSRVAAQQLSRQIQNHAMEKRYLAVVRGVPAAQEGTLRDFLLRDSAAKTTYPVQGPEGGAKEAVLAYRLLAVANGHSLLAVRLHTGRTHQIRVQLSSRGLPIVGDRKYGAGEDCPIALWSGALCFDHPQTGQRLYFSCPPPAIWPWTEFDASLLQFSQRSL